MASGPQQSINERTLLSEQLRNAGLKDIASRLQFLKYEESRDREEDNRKRRDLERLIASDSRLGVIIFDPHDKVTHVAPKFVEDFAELFYSRSIHPIMESIAQLRDTAVIITTDHGFCAIDRLASVKGIFAGQRHRESDFKYSTSPERAGHFGKRYIDLGDRTYDPRQAVTWLRYINDPEEWGLPDSNGFLIAVGDCGFSLEESEVRMFAHGGVSMEEMIVPIAVLKTRQ